MSWHEIVNTIIINIKSILKITIFTTMLIFIVLLFVYPKTYIATAKVLPPTESNNLGGLGSVLSGKDLSSFLLSDNSVGNSQLFIEILKSRSAANYVVNKLNLFDYLNTIDNQEAALKLSDDLDLNLSKEGIISVSVKVKSTIFPLIFSSQDSLKDLSASLSNTFIEALDNINNAKLSTKAKRAREFIEEQLVSTKIALDSSENNLMLFQMKNKTVSLPEQLKSVIEEAARLKSEITQSEIQLGLLQYESQNGSKIVSALEKKIEQLTFQYQKLDVGDQEYLLAFRQVPKLGKQLASLLREVKIQNELYLFLQQQYYREKIQENKDIPTIELLDEAIPPIKQSSPRVVYSTVIGSLFVFILVSLFFILKEKSKLSVNS